MDTRIKIIIFVLFLPIVFGYVFSVIWNMILNDEIPNLITLRDGLTFDYIIVGAGTAGSVLAAELSHKSNDKILLIEAGHTFGFFSKVPLLATLPQKTENDWAFLSTSQKYSSRGLIDQKQSLPRGKGLGGSSQLNYMLHFEGKTEDAENWEKLGASGWSYDLLKPYINLQFSNINTRNLQNCKWKSKNCDFNHISKETYPNKHNPRNVLEISANYSKISEAFEKASKEFKNQFNFYRSKYNIKNGLRWSVYEEYLRPSFQSTNLKILLNTMVRKIVIENHRAKSVLVKSTKKGESKIFKIHAKKEIILSAGAFQTPQLLQLSGIGPKKILEDFNIEVKFDSPNVGRNLFDHMNMPIYVAINESASLTLNKILSFTEIWKYLKTGEGHFGNFGVVGQITQENDTFGISIFGTGSIDEAALMSLSNFKKETFRSLFPLYYNSSQEGFVLLSTCLQPSSRGTVQIRSSQIEDLPEVDPNYLSNFNDIKCTITAIRAAVKIISSESFQSLNPKIYWPTFKECSQFGPNTEDFITNQPTDLYLICIIKTAALTSHHPGGSCSIGQGGKGVVDHDLRVNGVTNLRAVDASIMPSPVSGTPNSILIAIAKRATDIILRG